MQNALHFKSKVLRGHRIELTAPELEEGAPVDVYLVPSESEQPPSRSALEIISNLRGHRLFQSPEEVDRHLREERDAWDR